MTQRLGTASLFILLLESAPANGAGDLELKPGLVAEFFAVPAESSQLDGTWFTRTPLFRRIDPQVNYTRSLVRFGDTGLQENIGVRWSRVLRIPREGRYGLSVLRDDGVRVSIDDRPLLRDEEVGMSRLSDNSVQLTAGDHELLIEYCQSGGEMVCVLSWTQPAGKEEVIPRSVFFHAPRHLQAGTRQNPAGGGRREAADALVEQTTAAADKGIGAAIHRGRRSLFAQNDSRSAL